MVDATTLSLVVVRVLVIGLGLLIPFYGVTAYRRTRTRYIHDAASGFGVITLGVFIEGILNALGRLDLAVVHIVKSIAIVWDFLFFCVP